MCDTVVKVENGRVLFAKNSDRDPNEAQLISWHKARQSSPTGELRCTWVTIPDVAQTRAVMLSRPFWMWGAEMGTNDAGVVIGNEAVFTDQAMDDDGLLGMDLVRLGLERSGSAAEALEVIRALIERHGQGGRCSYSQPGFQYHNSFLIADAKEAFVLESAGRRVDTERVVGARAISNGLTLNSLRPHADRVKESVAQCVVRRHRTQEAALKASSVVDFFNILRDHGDERQWPSYSKVNGAMSSACMHAGGLLASSQTVGSWVSELTSQGPRHWATGTASPCLSLFKPISIEHPIDLGSPTGKAEDTSYWWRFERIHRELIKDLGGVSAEYLESRNTIESENLYADPRQAWSRSEEWLMEWAERFLDKGVPDKRPWWLKRHWREQDEMARESRLPAHRCVT